METTMTKAPSQNGGNLPVKRKTDVLKDVLNAASVQEQFKNALKENSGAFIAGIIDLYNSDTYLQTCEPKEVVMEALKAAVLKLPLNKSLGFAWIVPYNNSVKTAEGWTKKAVPTFQIGWKGYVQLAMRTGQYKFINADLVYEGELRSVNKLTGEIDFSGDRTSDNVIGYFAYIELVNGFSKTLYKTKQQVIDHAKRFSKSYDTAKSAWKTDFDAMAMKTVMSNLLSHYGFLSTEMIGAIDSEHTTDNKAAYSQDIDLHANTQTVDFEEASVVDDSQADEAKKPEQPEQSEQPQQQVDEQTGEIFPKGEVPEQKSTRKGPSY